MITPKLKVCKCGCGQKGYIWSHGCIKGHWKPDKPTNPVKRTPLKRTALKKKPKKTTGEYQVFKEIAETRPHICYVTGQLVDVYKADGRIDVRTMMHVVSKGANEALRLDPENIQIGLPRVHTIYDQGNEQERKSMEVYPGWFKLLELKEQLKAKNYNK